MIGQKRDQSDESAAPGSHGANHLGTQDYLHLVNPGPDGPADIEMCAITAETQHL